MSDAEIEQYIKALHLIEFKKYFKSHRQDIEDSHSCNTQHQRTQNQLLF